jgi:ATP-binding cassette, subfamily B, bacterial MsbA
MEHTDRKISGIHLLKRLLKEHVLRYRKRLVLAISCMMVVAAMTAANAYMMQPVLDKVFIEKNAQMLVFVPVVVFLIALCNAFAQFGQSFLMRYVGQRILADMQIDLFSHFMKCDLGLFHDQSSGRLISRFTNDIQMMRHAVSSALTTLTREVLTMLFLVGVMVYQSWELTLIALVVFPVAILPVMRLSRRMRKIADSTQAELGEFTMRLDEIFQGARTVKAYNRESYEVDRASSIIERLFALYHKAARVQSASSPMMELLSGIAIASVIAYGGAQVIEGTTTPGAFFSFITAFIMAYRPVKALAGLNTIMQEGLAAANRFFNALDSRPTITDAVNAAPLNISRGHVQFRDVTFHYAPDAGGVEHIEIDVPPGKKVALVGHSGGGKSTLFNLLLRFYDVQEGAITIDGSDIRSITQHSLREAIAFVPQEMVLFDDTVRNNIAYGRLDATEEEIHVAARGAQAEEFIERLPQGYDTMIGPAGVKLSGGQRQRLAIARAMLKRAPILLLDEATSALDNASERAVQDALKKLMEGRTTLIIAHRLSTIIHADTIYVIERGRVVESGTHEMLLKKGGAYHRLYAEQFAESA